MIARFWQGWPSFVNGRSVTISFILVAISIGGYGFGKHQSSNPPPMQRQLSVASQFLQIGTVWSQEGFEWHIPVENVSKHTIQVKSISGSCSCTGTDPSAFSIAANETIWVHVKIDLPSLLAPGDAKTDFRLSLFVETADQDSPYRVDELQLTGQVMNPYVLKVVSGFDALLIAGTPFSARAIEVTKNNLVNELRIKDDSLSIGRVTMQRTARENEYVLTLFPKESLAVGAHRGQIDLLATCADGKSQVVAPIRFPLVVVPDLHLFPETLLLDNAHLNRPTTCFVQVKSRSGKVFRILKNVVPADNGVKVSLLDPDSRNDDAINQMQLEITPQRRGVSSSKITVNVQYTADGTFGSTSLGVNYIGEEDNHDNFLR